MQKFAVLLTCFNRKEKSLAALESLFKAKQELSLDIDMSVYLTDDGSTDGTSEAIQKYYPKVNLLKGNGELFWAGGMRNSWAEALKNDYDAYLLLNDDTKPYVNFLEELFKTHNYCLTKYGKGGVYVGATLDEETNVMTYGGSVFTNKFKGRYTKLIPNGEYPQECELGNANIMLASKNAVDKIGQLSKGYVHGLADFDYTLKAKKNNVPVLLADNYLGTCTNDHIDKYAKFVNLSFKERLKMLHNPIGFDFESHLVYMKNHFLYRLPLVYLMGYFKVFFPSIYKNKILRK
ncbi:glycosyltransferase family 2 protein [Cellulophaga omnivescoria]|uniref:glycosyltransferase family 2 protein n=1 Tax=Cellulophaga omnivescoria TaxID=1888890 RepID=UPI000985C7A0|nr:glycosyltransferase family 2 protein [Cellulophaga omnivescoria]WBU88809.1 glycosyltransferase family 2 protein [Cellulophaga omnivescoria]